MFRYLIHRCLSGLITLIGITLITFVIISRAPGDPASIKFKSMQEKRAVSQRVYDQLRAYYGLDKPIMVRYGRWIGRLVRFDFGNSFYDGNSVGTKIKEALWPTLSVSLASLIVSLLLSLPIGIWSAAREGGVIDRAMSAFLYMLYSIPSYAMGMVLILFLGVKWNLLPFRGMHSDNYAQLGAGAQALDSLKHYALITICFTYGGLAYYARFTRQNLLEVIRQDYVRTARAKGLSEPQVVLKHAFINSMIPLITLMGLTIPELLSGSVILETMFNWPGLGRLYMDSVLQRDYPTLMALNFITAFLVLLGNLAADLAYGVVDPRVTYD
jgi:peptide/nickel transport system permease protein